MLARTSSAHSAGDVLAIADGVAIAFEQFEEALVSRLGKLTEQIDGSLQEACCAD